MATVYGGQGVVAGSPIPPGMPGHQPEIGLKYDVTAAKAELDTALKELGYSDVSRGPDPVLRLQHRRRSRDHRPRTCRSSGTRTSASRAS